MANVNNKDTRLTFKASVASKLSSVILLLLHAFCALLFFDGVSQFYGRKMSFGASIEIIFDIVDMGKAYYRGVFGAALGVLYVILFIIVVKNVLVSLNMCKNVFIGHDKRLQTVEAMAFKVGEKFMGSCLCIGVFTLMCSWVRDFMLPRNAKLVIACAVIGFILSRLSNYIIKGYNILAILIQTVYTLMFIAIVAILLIFAKTSVIADTADGIKMLATNIEDKKIINDLMSVAKPIIYGLITINTLSLISRANGYTVLQNSDTKSSAKKILTCVIVLLSCVFVVYMVNDGKVEFDKIYNLFTPYLSLAMVAVAAYFFTGLYSYNKRSDSSSKRESDIGKVDSDGVLRIRDGVTTIKAGIYSERRDITTIIIPKSVNVVEARAFSGCGAVTAIHCQLKGKPTGWHEDWSKGCYATVHWNSNG